MNRKKYFAQNPDGSRSKYFDTIDEAKQWLQENEGGTVKERDRERFFHVVLTVSSQ